MRPHDHKGLLHRGRDQHRHPEAARLDGSTILVDLRETDGAAGLKISAPKATTHNPPMDEPTPSELPNEDDDPATAIEKLIELFESGKVENAALRVNLADGSFEEFVLGSATEEERARMLKRLHEIVTSRMH
jgi:hypothetical protein